MTKWSRRSTAMTYLKRYQRIRAMRPELPQLVVSRFIIKPTLAETVFLEETNYDRAQSILFFRYGNVAMTDYVKLFEEYSEEYIFFSSIKLPRAKLKTHLPTAKIGQGYIFMTEEDAVMLKLLSPKLPTIFKLP